MFWAWCPDPLGASRPEDKPSWPRVGFGVEGWDGEGRCDSVPGDKGFLLEMHYPGQKRFGVGTARNQGPGMLPPCWWSLFNNLPAQRGHALCGPKARDREREGEQVPVMFLLLGAGTVEGSSLRREGREGQARGWGEGRPGAEPGERPHILRLVQPRSRLRCSRPCVLPSRYQRALGQPRVSAAEEGVLGLRGPVRPEDTLRRAQARPRYTPQPAWVLQPSTRRQFGSIRRPSLPYPYSRG